MEKIKEILLLKVSPEFKGKRLDHFLKEKLSEFSRNYLQNLIKEGFVSIKGGSFPKESLKPGYKLKGFEEIEVKIPEEKELELEPQDVPFDIIYEDEYLAVIEKPAGVVVHPAPGHYEGTLVHGLLKKLKNLSEICGVLRPGIVHRLDKDTSGLMIIAKNEKAHKALIEFFKNKKIKKEYLAIVYQVPSPLKGKIEGPIGRHPVNRKKMAILSRGKPAITHYQVLKIFKPQNFKPLSLVQVSPLTGRTHQIRVHFSSKGNPVAGDPIYGGLKPDIPKPPRLMLHAWKLSLKHPVTNQDLEFVSKIPEDMERYIESLEKLSSEIRHFN